MRHISALLIGLLGSSIIGIAIQNNHEALPFVCERVVAGEVSQEVWDSMRYEWQYKGIATDSMEALYSPGCF